MAFLKRILGINILLQTGVCFENAHRNPCNFTGSGQLSNFGTGWLIQTTIRDVMKADISLGNSGANCWTREKRMLWVICRMALYTEVTYYNAGS